MALNSAQIPVLKTAILAETDPVFVTYRTAGSTGQMADWFNVAGTKVVWRAQATAEEWGTAIQAGDLDSITTGNSTKLQTYRAVVGSVTPSRADHRAFFDGVFGGAAGAATRTSLAALWKRFALRGEAIFATGTGTDASPATLVYQGTIDNYDVIQAVNS